MEKKFLFLILVFIAFFRFINAENITSGNESLNFTACPQDAKVCADGSAVGRVPPNCDFAYCPFVNCVAEKGTCAGIQGAKCCEGLDCKLDSDFQDATGTCVKKAEGTRGLRIASPILFFIIAIVLIFLALKIAKWVLWLAALIAAAAAFWFIFINW